MKESDFEQLMQLMKKLLDVFRGYIPRLKISDKKVLLEFVRAIYHYKLVISCEEVFKFNPTG